MFDQRQGVIVWLYSLKQVKYFRRFGNIHYVSKRLKYIVVYMDMDEIEYAMKKMKSLSFVKKVEKSYRPFLKTEFENMTKRDSEEKEYDYKLGI